MLLGGARPKGFSSSTALNAPSASTCFCATVVIALFLLISASLQVTPLTSTIADSLVKPQEPQSHWITTWTTAPQSCALEEAIPGNFYSDNGVAYQNAFENATIRQTVRVTLGADEFRVQLSNVFTLAELQIDEATIARPVREPVAGEMTLQGSPGIDVTTLQTLTFSGLSHTTIPPGGQVLSDPVKLSVANGETVAISLYLADGQKSDVVTCHMDSRTHTWLEHGNKAAASTLKRASSEFPTSWYFLSAVEAWKSSDYGTVVLLGDSISDASRAAIDQNARWSDHLFDRLQSSSNAYLRKLSIANQAIGGNMLLKDRTSPNLNARLDRDALAIRGIKYAVIVEGVIDVAAGRDHVSAYVQLQQVVSRLHAARIPVFGSTMTPFSCREALKPWQGANLPLSEEQRLAMNRLIREEKSYDVVIDFDAVLRNPQNVTETAPEFMGDDCLHPSTAGFDAMVKGFPIDSFEKFRYGVDTETPTP